MNKTSILVSAAGALFAASLGLAGPAFAHPAGDGAGHPGPEAIGTHSQYVPGGLTSNDRLGYELPLAPIGESIGGRIFTPASATSIGPIPGLGGTEDVHAPVVGSGPAPVA